MSKNYKVITYNIHSGKNFWMIPQLNTIIHFLKYEKPDIIGIQEINENNKRGHQVSNLKKNLGIDAYFGPNVSIGDGYYGIATFASYPIIKKRHILFDTKREPRGLIDTLVNMDSKKLHIVNTHLSLNSTEREEQLNKIDSYLHNLKHPFIFLGDLNTTSPNLSDDLIDSGVKMGKEHQSTMVLSKKRLDYIYFSSELNVTNYDVIPVKMSDHYPVVVEFTFKD